MLGRGHAGESLDDASKEVTAPVGVAVIPQLHRDFSRPFQQPHSPQTTKAGHATDEKQATSRRPRRWPCTPSLAPLRAPQEAMKTPARSRRSSRRRPARPSRAQIGPAAPTAAGPPRSHPSQPRCAPATPAIIHHRLVVAPPEKTDQAPPPRSPGAPRAWSMAAARREGGVGRGPVLVAVGAPVRLGAAARE